MIIKKCVFKSYVRIMNNNKSDIYFTFMVEREGKVKDFNKISKTFHVKLSRKMIILRTNEILYGILERGEEFVCSMYTNLKHEAKTTFPLLTE